MDLPSFRYVGSELELFSDALNWKKYLADQIRPYLGRSVVEVGAGLGRTTRTLISGKQRRWLCVEPDGAFAAGIRADVSEERLPIACEVVHGTLADVPASIEFDTALYLDVLEHIEHDVREATRACDLLSPKGHLVVLAPAHSWLFSPFDRAIGHYRRYSKASLARCIPEEMRRVELKYLDAVGLLASCSNKYLLRQAMPTPGQIQTWDRLMVPLSRRLDPLLRFALGKSLLGVWRKV